MPKKNDWSNYEAADKAQEADMRQGAVSQWARSLAPDLQITRNTGVPSNASAWLSVPNAEAVMMEAQDKAWNANPANRGANDRDRRYELYQQELDRATQDGNVDEVNRMRDVKGDPRVGRQGPSSAWLDVESKGKY